jgi:hypothetical protein
MSAKSISKRVKIQIMQDRQNSPTMNNQNIPKPRPRAKIDVIPESIYNLFACTVSLNRGWESAEGVDFVSLAIISPIMMMMMFA